ncbi:MAG: hypothetical protein ACKN9F_08715 [Methylomonas sp.]
MKTQTYRILIDLSYDDLSSEAKQYINCLINKAKKSFIKSTILKQFHDTAIKEDDIETLLTGAFIDADQDKKVGCLWHFKTSIDLFIFSFLTGVAIPKRLRKNYSLLFQCVFIASCYFVEDDTDKVRNNQTYKPNTTKE